MINADIVLTQDMLKIEKVLLKGGMMAASSRRRDYKTKELLPDDKGRDIWILRPSKWAMVAREIPLCCRIGHQRWDSWMMGFCRERFKGAFGEFSDVPCVFHPRHEERQMPHASEIVFQTRYDNVYRQNTIITIDPIL